LKNAQHLILLDEWKDREKQDILIRIQNRRSIYFS